MMHRLAKGVGKPKPTPICPFLFHLYEGQGLLTADEELDYRTAKEMAGYRITPDPDLRLEMDKDEAIPIPAPSPQPRPLRTPNRRRKSTYRAPDRLPPVRSRGPSSPVPPEPQPRAQQPARGPDSQPQGARLEKGQEWVEKPFVDVSRSIRQARIQYESMEEALEQIGSELGMRPKGIIPMIRSLSKAQEMEELRAQMVGLLKENVDVQAQVADRDRKLEEAEARAATVMERRIRAEAESEKWHGVSQKFFDSVGFTGDVVTKARLYDQCMKKPEAVSVPKVLCMLFNFSRRVENPLKKLRLLLQPDGRGQEAGPSERRWKPGPGPSQPEPTSPPTSTPDAPAIKRPSASTPKPEAMQGAQEPAATLGIPDPTHQEPISDSLNIDDIPSLHQWGTEGLWDSGTPTTGSQGPTDPVIRITPGSIAQSWRRRTGSIQANLFGEAQEEPVEGFRRWVQNEIVRRAQPAEEARSSSEGEDDPVGDDEKDEDKDDEEEDEEDKEDPGSSNAYDSGDEEEDDDSPLASSHRPVIRSTPKKPVSWPKRKAYRTKSGLGSSSRKQTRGSQ